MDIELLRQYGELLAWFKAACTLAIILGTGCGAAIAMFITEHRHNREIEDINRELHRELDEAQKGHMVALATLAEERLASKGMR